MDNLSFKRLESFVSQGRVILFTGAGFSRGAMDREGRDVPGVWELTTELWDLAFPGEPHDGSGLQDVFEAAMMQAKTKAVDLMRSRLTIDAKTLPDYYARWFSLPWRIIYTLNIDTLADAANSAFDLPRALVPVSASSGPVPLDSDTLPVVHLNGRLSLSPPIPAAPRRRMGGPWPPDRAPKGSPCGCPAERPWTGPTTPRPPGIIGGFRLSDLPDGVTFSGRQYGERLAASDLWYANLSRELVGQPFIFVGTTLDEPPLWRYIEERGGGAGGGRELRPGSYLVTKDLPKARAVALRRYQVEFIAGTAASFEDDVLGLLDDAASQGLSLIKRASASAEAVLHDLEDLVDDSEDDEREFLLGREPRWSDITAGYAVERQSDVASLDLVKREQPKLVVYAGTAGSGKGTSAMRLALALRAQGKSVVKLNLDADHRNYAIRAAVIASSADVLFIDDLDRLGHRASQVLNDIADSAPDLLVIAALRSARYDALEIDKLVGARNDALEIVVPLLTDDDVDLLLDALEAANRLGALRGKPRATQRALMTSKCGRQLLVAMIEATSGKQFEAKIESECRELSPEALVIYGVVAVAMNFRIRISAPEVMAAVGGDPAANMRTLDQLVRTHLLVRSKKGFVELRHRVIGERAVNFFRSARLIETPLRGLIFAMAAAATPGNLRDSIQGRGAIRLINHTLLINFLRAPGGWEPDLVGIRGVYEEVESLLTHDFHFWLQRGSFETETGDLDLAINFIEQARGLAPDDAYVQLQWAYATLKRASRNPTFPGAPAAAQAAFEALEESIARRGKRDSYAFHVYGSQGLAWANRGGLAPDEKERLLLALRRVVDEGITLHSTNRELRQLAKDLEAAYLKLSVV